jgi:PleD family two-component response regulator
MPVTSSYARLRGACTSCRSADTPARLGGDELPVMVGDLEESAARNADVAMCASKRGFSVYQRETEVAR